MVHYFLRVQNQANIQFTKTALLNITNAERHLLKVTDIRLAGQWSYLFLWNYFYGDTVYTWTFKNIPE